MKKNDIELVDSRRGSINKVLNSFGLASEVVNFRQAARNTVYVDLSYLDEYYRLLSTNSGDLWERIMDVFELEAKKVGPSDSGFTIEFSSNKDSIIRYLDDTAKMTDEVVLGYNQDDLVTASIGNMFVAGENAYEVAVSVAYTITHKHSAKNTVMAILTEGGPLEDYANTNNTVAFHKYEAGQVELFKNLLEYIKIRPTTKPALVVILDNVLQPMLRAGVSPATVYQQAREAGVAVMIFEDVPMCGAADIKTWLLGNSVSRGVGGWLSNEVAAELGALHYKKEVLEVDCDFAFYNPLKERIAKFSTFFV